MGKTGHHNHGMDGPCACAKGSIVLDTRGQPSGEIWRRRKCKQCLAVFTTLEYHCDTSGYTGEQRERKTEVRTPKKRISKPQLRVELPPPAKRIEKPKASLDYEPSIIERVQRMREQRELEKDDGLY